MMDRSNDYQYPLFVSGMIHVLAYMSIFIYLYTFMHHLFIQAKMLWTRMSVLYKSITQIRRL